MICSGTLLSDDPGRTLKDMALAIGNLRGLEQIMEIDFQDEETNNEED
jgi:hypothetical protein